MRIRVFAVRASSSSERSAAGRKVEGEVGVVAVAVVAGGVNEEGLRTRVDSDEPWQAIREPRGGKGGGKGDLGFEPDEFISS